MAGAKCVTTFFSEGYWMRWHDRLMFLLYRPLIAKVLSNCKAGAIAAQRLAFAPEAKCVVLANGIECRLVRVSAMVAGVVMVEPPDLCR